MSEVLIDRLVLDLPGMDAAAARALALGIADNLADAGIGGEHSLRALTIDATPGADPERLAAQIAHALLGRVG